MVNSFSVDVEDYFHPTEVGRNHAAWPDFPSRLDVGVDRLLELLDNNRIRGTFFILGWVATHQPEVVRRIADAGHEIGCHSYHHPLVYRLTPAQFRQDTRRAVQAIEDACGYSPKLYRAPSYSIVASSFWALEILAELGFTHDSSVYPIVHDRYGIPGFPRHAHVIETPSGPIMEVPIATAKLSANRIAPVGGGAYLRLFPYRYTAAGIRTLNEQEAQPACVYTHPWELDPEQPRMTKGVISSLRTYTGLGTVTRKLQRLCQDFEFSSIGAVHPWSKQAPASAQRLNVDNFVLETAAA